MNGYQPLQEQSHQGNGQHDPRDRSNRGRGVARHRKVRPRSARRSRLATATVLMLGVLVMSYPSVASWVDQVIQSGLVDSYRVEVDTIAEDARLQALEDAREYNEELKEGRAYDPYADGSGDVDPDQWGRYLKLLEGVPSHIMSRIRIPSIEVDLPVYHGTSDQTLRVGVGHLYGTALPVGGAGTHAVLTAHSGMADAVMFTNLEKVQIGDLFQLETYGEKFTYRVVDSNVILPNDTEILRADPNHDLVSLVTCTPVTVNSHRLIVTGERVPNPPEPSERMPDQDLPGFPWWVVWIGATFAASTIYVLRGSPRNDRHQTKP